MNNPIKQTKSIGFMACGKYYEMINSESYIKYLQKLIHQIQNKA